MTIIQKFAKTHKLKVVTGSALIPNCKIRTIAFGSDEDGDPEAVIYDIEQESRLRKFVTAKAQKDFIAKVQKENLLGLVLFTEHQNHLFDSMYFDVPSYDGREGLSHPDVFCNDSAWYVMLKALGFEHEVGDDNGLCLTFPALCPKASNIALMLAGHRDEDQLLDDDEDE